jgi:hypothetical protein
MHVYSSFPEVSKTDSTVTGGFGNHAWHYQISNPDVSSHGASLYALCLKQP